MAGSYAVGGSSASEQSAVLEPHLQEFGRGDSTLRYPNPFFDLAQQYTPRTVKELFKWCTYFYYTNPLISATVTKISKYPITDLIIDDPDDRVKERWGQIFNDQLKIKDRCMEINLDLNVYGNAFVSLHLPFTRYLICGDCGNRNNIENLDWKWNNFSFNFTCPRCNTKQKADPNDSKQIKDVPYRAVEEVRLVRWNPENIALRYNEVTGESHYFYSVSKRIRNQVHLGEKEIIEKLPLLFLQAIRRNRLIKLSERNLFHLKRPTLAEKDMGWGKPLIQPVLKDLYYMATLRKAQEAIANEHIVPFDFLYPQPNAQMDPFVHTDLGNWKVRTEDAIRKRRRDPNYKAVMPVPIGFGRLGGDGKALMLTPELNYLNQTIVGGMGIPQEFLFGGLNWTGSSITLRSLQNDFQHNQTQLLDIVKWIKEKLRVFLRIPGPRKLRFMDFKMADDIQRIQQLIGLNAQRKISDETLLTELNLDYEKEQKKMMQELEIQNEMQDAIARSQARTSGETQIIAWNYQQKIQELQEEAVKERQKELAERGEVDEYGGPQAHPYLAGGAQQGAMLDGQAQLAAPQGGAQMAGPSGGMGAQAPAGGGAPAGAGGQSAGGAGGQSAMGGQAPRGQAAGGEALDINAMAQKWAKKLMTLEPMQAREALAQIKSQDPKMGQLIEQALNQIQATAASGGQAGAPGAPGAPGAAGGGSAGQSNPSGAQVNMNPMPEKGAPTRAGSF